MLKTLTGLNTDELRALVRDLGEAAYRGNQLAAWVYRRQARTFAEMTSLPEELRARLGRQYRIGGSRALTIQHSRDGTTKLLLELGDGATVETVGLPYADRFSCCLSTQVGCPVGCIFCATGRSGYTRNLTAGEIIEQVLAVEGEARNHRSESGGGTRRIDHVTFMGMGEPLLNYMATLKAMQLLNGEMGMAMRNMTISTVGFVPGIRQLAQEKRQVTLAISLHAPADDLRRKLIPGMTQWKVAEIVDACREYFRQTGRRITFEYCLLDGVNDGAAEARELGRVLHGLNCHVNLIPYNPVSGLAFCAPPRKQVRAFRDILESGGIRVTQRVQRGSDIDAACGQLRRRMPSALSGPPPGPCQPDEK